MKDAKEAIELLTALNERLCEEWYRLNDGKHKEELERRLAAGGIEKEYLDAAVYFLETDRAEVRAEERKACAESGCFPGTTRNPSPLIEVDVPGEAPHLPWREALDIANAEIATLRAQLAEERAKHEGWNDSDEELYQWTKSENRRAHPAPDATALRAADIKDDSYLWGNGRHQRLAGIWFRIVGNKIVDRDQYRHDLESRADALLRSEPREGERG